MSPEDWEKLLTTRLDPPDALSTRPPRGDRDLNPDWPVPEPRVLRPAAVLAPIVRRPEGWTLLFTQRAEETPAHPGQISFPGGRMQDGDAGPVETALRETFEEIGVEPRFIRPLGGVEPYETGTGFSVTPVVGFVEPGFALKLCAREVAEVFEAPFAFFMDPANHERRTGEWRGRRGAYYAMPYQGRFIWGATAGMIRAIYERLYA